MILIRQTEVNIENKRISPQLFKIVFDQCIVSKVTYTLMWHNVETKKMQRVMEKKLAIEMDRIKNEHLRFFMGKVIEEMIGEKSDRAGVTVAHNC